MEITIPEIAKLAKYIADYIANSTEGLPDDVDSFMVAMAIDAYLGGAADTE